VTAISGIGDDAAERVADSALNIRDDCFERMTVIGSRRAATGLNSGHLAGSSSIVMFDGTARPSDICQPAWSTSRTAMVAWATSVASSARCKVQVHRSSSLYRHRVAAKRAPHPFPFSGEPDLYCGWIDALFARNRDRNRATAPGKYGSNGILPV
jgi:hypothetical protein